MYSGCGYDGLDWKCFLDDSSYRLTHCVPGAIYATVGLRSVTVMPSPSADDDTAIARAF